jgi:RING-like zinc finger
MANGVSSAENDHNAAIEDCCICLYAIAPFQALFVAPCSHTFHYKCCRPLLQNHPGFLCPLCRTYADLEASVAVEASEVIIEKKKKIFRLRESLELI